ncbi:hypothetical protein RX330_20320 [Bradyrhizobium sp. NDS-1]|uniref:hypothetical protein n=1 Tax=Bradyrhizobium sp. NDS-1 TaxID=3080014 RepID=UPI00293F6E37|nr:hypothetical protein [Bradyrhizobium sp. NDS-1]WOH70645.1 hypothetical protein RX330_20320 [Bradyrhizobium sp. NDS-1]
MKPNEDQALLTAVGYLARQPLTPEANRAEAVSLNRRGNEGVLRIFDEMLSREDGAEQVTAWMANLVAAAERGEIEASTMKALTEEMFAQDEDPPKPLLDYWNRIRHQQPPKSSGRPGPKPVDRAARDRAIVRTVAWIARESNLEETRNYSARDVTGAPHSACSIVAMALGILGVSMTEDRVNQIWSARP